jgi:D-alanine-D-alanine ligase
MYPKLWAAAGVAYGDLVDRLIQFGLERHLDRKDLQSTLS